jgi:heme exporter protein D
MFFAFGLLGRAIGPDLWKFRVGIALLSYLTLLLFFRLCRATCDGSKPWLSPYATVALALSPYYLGASFYYYTDIPCLFLIMVTLSLYLSDRPLGGAIAAGAAMLTRQFSVFLPAAYALASMANQRHSRIDLRQATLLLVPFGMLLPLVLLWGGLSPQNHLRPILRQAGYFHPEFVNYLVLATGVYCLPLAVLRVRHLFQRRRLVIISCLTPLFWLAIPRPNPAVMNPQVKTLGLLDIALTNVFGDYRVIPYFLLWLLGCLILHEVFHIERHEGQQLIFLSVAGFFVMHAFAPSVWDKYLLPVLPLVFLSLARGYARPAGFASVSGGPVAFSRGPSR